MEAKALTPVQEDLLKMFAFDHSDSFAKEIKKVLKNYIKIFTTASCNLKSVFLPGF